jgi:two-component system nitrate/nitrite response regulator NarL
MPPFGDLHTAIHNDSSNGAGSARPVRVLLADDHQPMLDRVAALVSGEFTVVAAVNDGGEAVSAAARLQPDVLVLDISMPDVNGLEAAVRVK